MDESCIKHKTYSKLKYLNLFVDSNYNCVPYVCARVCVSKRSRYKVKIDLFCDECKFSKTI